MVKNLILKRNSVFFSWLATYFLILLIPIVFSCIIYFESVRIIENEVNVSNTVLLKEMQQAMDSRLEDIEKLSMQLGLNQSVCALLYAGKSLQDYEYNTIIDLTHDLKTFNITNSFVENFYIYFNNGNFALVPDAKLDGQIAYDLYHGNDLLSYDAWREMVSSGDSKKYIPVTRKGGGADTIKSVSFVRRLPIDDSGDPTAAVVILLDLKRLQEAVKNVNWVKDGRVIVMDRENNILVDDNKQNLPVMLTYDELDRDIGFAYKEMNGRMTAVSYITSKVNGWKYVIAIPVAIYMNKVSYIRIITIISVVSSIILGGVIAFFFTRRNYNPVNRLIKTLQAKANMLPNTVTDEYGFIEGALTRTLDENIRFSNEVRQKNIELQSELIVKLLKGKCDQLAPGEDIKPLDLISDKFMVMLFSVEEYSTPGDTEDSENSNLLKFVIKNVVEELVGIFHKGFTVNMDDYVACLINLKKEECMDIRKDMEAMAERVRKLLLEQFQTNLTVSVSEVHTGFPGISKAYHEALEAIEYKLIMGMGKIIHYEDIKHASQQYYYYPMEIEKQLTNCIKVGDYENAGKYVNNIFKINFSKENLSIQAAKCLLFNMVGTVITIISEISVPSQKEMIEKLNPVEQLLNSRTIIEMEEQMMVLLKKVCEYIEKNKKSHNVTLKDDILLYISEYYHDVNMSIGMIADRFKLNADYLSRFFREQTGESLIDHINILRLVKAKEILARQQMNIKEVAEAVGYYNSNALIRAFKKHEGITPGKYKQS